MVVVKTSCPSCNGRVTRRRMILLRSHEKYAGGSILTEDYMVCVLPCHIYFKPERWPIQRARKPGRRKLGIQVNGWHWVLKPVAMRARADMRSEKRCSTPKSKLINSGYACSMAGYGLLTGPGGYRANRCRYILYWVSTLRLGKRSANDSYHHMPSAGGDL